MLKQSDGEISGGNVGQKADPLVLEWKGSKYRPQHIHHLLLREISPLPWPIRVLGIEDFKRDVIFVRKDVGLHLWWMLAIVWYRLFYNPRRNPNSIVNMACFKLQIPYWKLLFKYKYHSSYKELHKYGRRKRRL